MKSKHVVNTILAAFSLALSGCVTTEPVRQSAPSALLNSLPAEQTILISLCRPKSVMRFAETPVFEVNGTVAAEISNGSKHEFALRHGDKFRINLAKNYLMQRFSDSQIFEGTAEKPGRVYMMLATNSAPDWGAGISTLFMGAITASVLQKMNEPPQNWHIYPLKAEDYDSRCAQ